MMKPKTALILGAGASYNYGYPLGSQLKYEILNILKGIMNEVEELQEKIERLGDQYRSSYETLKFMATEHLSRLSFTTHLEDDNLVDFLVVNCEIAPNIIIRLFKNLEKAHLNTIDAFLEERPEFLRLGQILIAIAILRHEDDDIMKSPLNGKHWYNYLLNKIGTSWKSLQISELAIVTYNYDRTLEHYIVNSFVNTYGKEENDDYKQCIELAQRFKLYHIHGQVGSFSWGLGINAKPYRAIMECQQVLDAANNIKVISQINAEESYNEVYGILNWAEQIFILGFGFDDRNLERLDLSSYRKPIYASRTGISDLELREIKEKVGNSILFSPIEGYDILDFFKRGVSLSGIRSELLDTFRFPFESKVK